MGSCTSSVWCLSDFVKERGKGGDDRLMGVRKDPGKHEEFAIENPPNGAQTVSWDRDDDVVTVAASRGGCGSRMASMTFDDYIVEGRSR